MANNTDALGTRARDTMLPVVPLFTANSWAFRVLGAAWAPSGDARREARRRIGL